MEVSLLQDSDVSHASIFGSFHAGIYDYYVINLRSSRDGAINWCKNNLDAVLPLPNSEPEYEVNHRRVRTSECACSAGGGAYPTVCQIMSLLVRVLPPNEVKFGKFQLSRVEYTQI